MERAFLVIIRFPTYQICAICLGMTEDESCSPNPSLNPLPQGERALGCTRALPKQATSAVAYVGEAPEDDDPLLGFAPYLHPAPRSNSITPERQRRFVATLAATGIVNQAARSIGKSMEALYKLRHKPGAEGFAAAWDAALERGVQRLEDCALTRAMQGTPTPIVSGGKLLDWYDKPDNALLRFLLQHRLPERYGIQRIQPGTPIYESIKKQVLAEAARHDCDDEAEVLASIDALFDSFRREARAHDQGDLEEESVAFVKAAGGSGCAPAGDWSNYTP
jgi:hypothetical protein